MFCMRHTMLKLTIRSKLTLRSMDCDGEQSGWNERPSGRLSQRDARTIAVVNAFGDWKGLGTVAEAYDRIVLYS